MLITEKDKITTYYQALLSRNSSYVGIFFVGVKTTNVFCIATCRARKPKFENVQFYSTFKSALSEGFRPCKICKPTENSNEAPAQVEKAVELVRNNPKYKITDHFLRQNNISPEGVRRWFKKNYGMTFQSFQRMYRINIAYEELNKGKSTTHTAFDSGYESLSGFGYTFKKILGKSPGNLEDKDLILISRMTTPLGPMFICSTKKGICLSKIVDRPMLEAELKELQKLFKAQIVIGENDHIKRAQLELKEYFQLKRRKFEVNLDTPGTSFQQKVWNSLKIIPYGATLSYQEQADLLKKPKAIRAIANANGFNRVSIIIPCHRVMEKNGNLTGYGGGLERKRWLLNHENKNYSD